MPPPPQSNCNAQADQPHCGIEVTTHGRCGETDATACCYDEQSTPATPPASLPSIADVPASCTSAQHESILRMSEHIIAPPPPLSQRHTRGLGSSITNLFDYWKICGSVPNFILLWRRYHHTQCRHHTHTPHPDQHPHPMYTTPMPTPPTWESQKSDSTSRQRRLLALSASTTLPGHGVFFLRVPRW